jgi:mannose-6-phosphate isomerase
VNTSAVTLCPARLEPIFVPRIWGARRLDPLFPEKTFLAESVGEAWLTGHECRFAGGPFAGQTLGDVWRAMSAEWTGRRLQKDGPFPLLVKFLFPNDKLSVQVHPNDDYARRHEAAAGGMGKTEMWYAIEARPGAEVMVGLKAEVTPESFRRAIAGGTAERCLERVPVATGDAIFVPAGTVHTIGPSMTLCEIQEHSDLTYRVYDYNRLTAEGKPRELHIEKAMDVIYFGEQSGGKLEPVKLSRGPVEETYYVACRYFAVEKWAFASRIAAATTGEHFDLFITLEGNGRFEWAGGANEYAAAQTWLIPAALGAYQIAPARRSTFLRAYVPDIANDFVQRLKDRGVTEDAWARLVYP